MAASRGTCQDCRKRFRLTVDGDVYLHNSVEKHDGVWVSDVCTGSHQEPLAGSVRAPRVQYGAIPEDGHYHYRPPEEIAWSWWDAHGWKVWMGMLWIGGAMFGSGVTIILRNLAEGRGWLG